MLFLKLTLIVGFVFVFVHGAILPERGNLTERGLHLEPYCTPTGKGTCTFAYAMDYTGDNILPDYNAKAIIYDRFCNAMACMTRGHEGHVSMYSPLPYTVEADLWFRTAFFNYAGKSYGHSKDDCWCYMPAATSRIYACQCAFDCSYNFNDDHPHPQSPFDPSHATCKAVE